MVASFSPPCYACMHLVHPSTGGAMMWNSVWQLTLVGTPHARDQRGKTIVCFLHALLTMVLSPSSGDDKQRSSQSALHAPTNAIDYFSDTTYRIPFEIHRHPLNSCFYTPLPTPPLFFFKKKFIASRWYTSSRLWIISLSYSNHHHHLDNTSKRKWRHYDTWFRKTLVSYSEHRQPNNTVAERIYIQYKTSLIPLSNPQ